MRHRLPLKYTSGFVLTGDEVVELAQHLDLPHPEDASEAAWLISGYMLSCDELLEPFSLQTVSLYEEKPTYQLNESPETLWMIPTRRGPKNEVIDPLTHENTNKVKAAVMATGVPKEYLTRFQTYPNKEYPWTIIKISPPPTVFRNGLPPGFGTRKFMTLSEFCEKHAGEFSDDDDDDDDDEEEEEDGEDGEDGGDSEGSGDDEGSGDSGYGGESDSELEN